MKMVPVQSSNVKAVGYNPATKVMHVQFASGQTYSHAGVSVSDHAKFMTAPSVGKHYHANFKDRFGVGKVG